MILNLSEDFLSQLNKSHTTTSHNNNNDDNDNDNDKTYLISSITSKNSSFHNLITNRPSDLQRSSPVIRNRWHLFHPHSRRSQPLSLHLRVSHAHHSLTASASSSAVSSGHFARLYNPPPRFSPLSQELGAVSCPALNSRLPQTNSSLMRHVHVTYPCLFSCTRNLTLPPLPGGPRPVFCVRALTLIWTLAVKRARLRCWLRHLSSPSGQARCGHQMRSSI